MVIKNTDYCLLTVVSYYFVARHETKWYSCLKIVVTVERMFSSKNSFLCEPTTGLGPRGMFCESITDLLICNKF